MGVQFKIVFARSVTTKQSSPKNGRDCRADKSARKDVAVKTIAIDATKPAEVKQSGQNIVRNCRADKSARKNAGNRQLNTPATRKSAFTLAEVLITLVIIGIIAAITVPTLMANYRKQEVSSRLKKFYSNLSNAVRLADMENPGFIKSTYSARETDYGQWWNDTLGKYMPVTEKANSTYAMNSTTDSSYIPDKIYVLNDGSIIIEHVAGRYDVTTNFMIDINGEKAPNAYGKDIFGFSVGDRHESKGTDAISKNIFVCTHWSYCGARYIDYTRDRALQDCVNSSPTMCAKLLQYDGWQVKDDYPLSI
ncbi:MAG: type II secretion system GspH family protein [Candidatus Gastranaerophilales bacterium]|nr:type II secretion system GspH family protein [Candidatus Gastranaerophilales bacterium]